MRNYFVAQVLQLVVVVFGISVLVFVMLRLTGDPIFALLPPDATRQQADDIRQRMGLDQPLPVQYLVWLSDALHGDFGRAFFAGRQPALDLVVQRIPATLTLGSLGLALSMIISVPLGVLAAIKHNSWIDRVVTVFVTSGQAMPGFWFGIVLIIVFAVDLAWLPPSGMAGPKSLVLPVVVLGLLLAPPKLRLVRSRMIDVLDADYVRTARAKGLNERAVLWEHAFRNVATTVVAILGLQTAYLLEGTIVVETVFGWPGLGSLLLSSIGNADYPVVQAAVVIIAFTTVTASFVTDVAICAIDPRIRLA